MGHPVHQVSGWGEGGQIGGEGRGGAEAQQAGTCTLDWRGGAEAQQAGTCTLGHPVSNQVIVLQMHGSHIIAPASHHSYPRLCSTCKPIPLIMQANATTTCKPTPLRHKHPLVNRRVSSDRPRVILDSVTIVLPAASFMPLRALAMVGGLASLPTSRELYPEWAPLHDLSLDGLSSFNVSRLVSWFGRHPQITSDR